MPNVPNPNSKRSEAETGAGPPLRLTPGQLAWAFAEMSLHGFGGVMPWARRVLVERRGWVEDREFTELLSVCQLIPGDNVSNLAVMFGDRYGGTRGALAALGGLLGPSLTIALTLGWLYRHFGGLAAVQGAMRGTSAVVAGLLLVTGIKLLGSQPRLPRVLVFGVLAFLAVGVVRLPLAWALLTLIPAAILVEWRASR